MNNFERTIKASCELKGKGLHLGLPVHMQFHPADEGTGIIFRITKNGTAIDIPALAENLHDKLLRTAVSRDGVVVETVEHVLAAARGLGVSNMIIEMDQVEPAAMDGSAEPLCKLLTEVGVVDQSKKRESFIIREPLAVCTSDGSSISAYPYPNGLKISYYLSGEGLPDQHVEYEHSEENFLNTVAKARTFCREFEVEALREMPEVGEGADLNNTLLVKLDTLEKDQKLKNELAWHKVLDLIGDLSLFGKEIKGHLVCHRSGHTCNQRLVKKLHEHEGVGFLNINNIKDILPHAYPFLLVDRILEYEEKKRVVGLKNVTINEPFFIGHFPDEPIMPGVLLIEALAQTGAVFIYRNNAKEQLVLFTGVDKVKFRNRVVPGDQVLLTVEAKNMKASVGLVKAVATVRGAVVCEAELKFMIVDK